MDDYNDEIRFDGRSHTHPKEKRVTSAGYRYVLDKIKQNFDVKQERTTIFTFETYKDVFYVNGTKFALYYDSDEMELQVDVGFGTVGTSVLHPTNPLGSLKEKLETFKQVEKMVKTFYAEFVENQKKKW